MSDNETSCDAGGPGTRSVLHGKVSSAPEGAPSISSQQRGRAMASTSPLAAVAAAIRDDDGPGLRLAWAAAHHGVDWAVAEQALDRLADLEARSPEYRALNRRITAYDQGQFTELWSQRAVLAGNRNSFDATWKAAGSLPGEYWQMMDGGSGLDTPESKDCARRFWKLVARLCAEPDADLAALVGSAVGRHHGDAQRARAALSGMPPALIEAHARFGDAAQQTYADALLCTVGRLGEPLGDKGKLSWSQERIKQLTENASLVHEAKTALADEALRRGLFPAAAGNLTWAKALFNLHPDRSSAAPRDPTKLEWAKYRPKDGAGRHLGAYAPEMRREGAVEAGATIDTEHIADDEPDSEDVRAALTKMLVTPGVLSSIRAWPGCKEQRVGPVLDALRLLIWHEPQLRDEHRRRQRRRDEADDARRRDLAFMPHRIYRLALETADPGAQGDKNKAWDDAKAKKARNKALDRERAFVAYAMLCLLEAAPPPHRGSPTWWRLYLPAQVAMVTCAVIELNSSGISARRNIVSAELAAAGLEVIGRSISASDRLEHGRLVRTSYDVAITFDLWRRVGACLDKLAADNRVPAETASALAAANDHYAEVLDNMGRSMVERCVQVLGPLAEHAMGQPVGGDHQDTGRARLERRVKTTVMAIRELEMSPSPASQRTLETTRSSKLLMRQLLTKLDGAPSDAWAEKLRKLITELGDARGRDHDHT